MALIVEVLHPRTGEVRQRLRLEHFPCAVGRQLDNQLILDDPYVDPHHARFVLDDDGALVLEDLGSLNKLSTHSHAGVERVRLVPGAEVQLGRTRLRLRDESAPVAAALSLKGVADRPSADGAWHQRRPVRVAILVVAGALVGASAWLNTAERDGATVALTATLGFALLAALWAGIWAVAGRAAVGQFRFGAHLAIAAWVAALVVLVDLATTWLEFLVPENGVGEALQGVILLVALGVVVAWHLGDASMLSVAKRYRAGAIVTGLVLVIASAFTLLDDGAFTDVPEFSSVIKSAPVGLVPTHTVEEFGAAIVDLRAEVDSLLAKPVR